MKKERRKKERKKPQGKNIMVCPIPQGDHNYWHCTLLGVGWNCRYVMGARLVIYNGAMVLRFNEGDYPAVRQFRLN